MLWDAHYRASVVFDMYMNKVVDNTLFHDAEVLLTDHVLDSLQGVVLRSARKGVRHVHHVRDTWPSFSPKFVAHRPLCKHRSFSATASQKAVCRCVEVLIVLRRLEVAVKNPAGIVLPKGAEQVDESLAM